MIPPGELEQCLVCRGKRGAGTSDWFLGFHPRSLESPEKKNGLSNPCGYVIAGLEHMNIGFQKVVELLVRSWWFDSRAFTRQVLYVIKWRWRELALFG